MANAPSIARIAPASQPVRLLSPRLSSPFAPGRDVAFARLSGPLLDDLGLREDDHVAVVRRDHARDGDLASVAGPDGLEDLWRVHLEGEALRLAPEDAARARFGRRRPRVCGVVVGVLRKFEAAPLARAVSSGRPRGSRRSVA